MVMKKLKLLQSAVKNQIQELEEVKNIEPIAKELEGFKAICTKKFWCPDRDYQGKKLVLK
jgi:hypothetical protein